MSKKDNTIRRKRGAEIYFVLYLSALILLLPGKQEKKSSDAVDAISALFQQSFSLLPEKNTLLSRVTTDSTGMPILQLDTSNVLLLTGNVEDVTLECIVEDQNAGEIVQVNSKQGEHFTIVYDTTKKLVFFSWHPPYSLLASLNASKSYVVTVKAKAKPFIGKSNPELKQLLKSTDATLQTEAKFSISILTEGLGEAMPKIVYMPAETTFTRMIFQPALMTQDTQQISPANTQNVGVPVFQQEFSGTPREPIVATISMQEWTTKIFVQGIYDLNNYAQKPTITILSNDKEHPGTAELIDWKANELVIGGIAPMQGRMEIKVNAKRKFDNKEISPTIVIDPTMLAEPDIPKMFYPGYAFKIDPKMPAPYNVDKTAVLKSAEGIQVTSQQGTPFMFTPEMSDTGKTLILERYVNGKKVGKSYPIRVYPFMEPEIVEHKKVGNTIIVEVRSFGRYNGRPNFSKIEFVKGAENVSPAQDNRADYDARNEFFTKQRFQIRAKDPDKPFKVSLYAIDKYGKVSSIVNEYTD